MWSFLYNYCMYSCLPYTCGEIVHIYTYINSQKYRPPFCTLLEAKVGRVFVNVVTHRRWKVYLRLGGHQWWCVRKYTHARGVWGRAPPKFFKTRCFEITSEAIFVLKSGQFLPWTCLALLCDKIVQGSLSHHCTYSCYTRCGSKGVKKVTIPDSLKGGGTKGQILTKGGAGHMLLVPPGSAAYVSSKQIAPDCTNWK